MRLNKYFEFVQDDFEPIKSFYLKDELSPKVWDGNKIKQDIREQLLTVSQDFYNTTDLDAEIKDIILTGSLANYNWSNKYSDFDLSQYQVSFHFPENAQNVPSLAHTMRHYSRRRL
jgi:hypothetical protein